MVVVHIDFLRTIHMKVSHITECISDDLTLVRVIDTL